jgi:PhzF family phenazine biosynthesis protein
MPGRSAALFCVDSFTTERFRGNPAAVCLLDDPADEDWMQGLAAEMNLSETAFVTPETDGYGLRWFTPTIEAVLCGHATLASAHVLWETGRLPPSSPIEFHTRWKGALTATRVDTRIAVDFPAATSTTVAEPPGLSGALGAPIVAVAHNDLHHIVELADERTVRDLAPDIDALATLDVEAVAVTARSLDPQYDFVSRFFAPKYGIREDPVTGSAHCGLGPYWSAKLGKPGLVAHQVSRRGGELRVDDHGARVTITGPAVTVWSGIITS